MVGRLGLVGVAAVLGMLPSHYRCIMSVASYALRIAVPDLQRVMGECPQLREQLLSYVHALLIHSTQSTLCNTRHVVEKRLIRRLLLAADRLDDSVIPITHNMLSMSLGVRRASITTTLADLERPGRLVRLRGAIDLVNRVALEARACECYRIISSGYGHLSRNGLHEHRITAAAGLLATCSWCA